LPERALIGMVHLEPLPGSPAGEGVLARVVDAAREDARRLEQSGFDALIVENFGDAPFRPICADPHTVSCMTVVVQAVRDAVGLPIGVNVLRNDALAAVAIATVCECAFVRINVHCGVYATDQGVIEGRADETLRYRRHLAGGAASRPGGAPAIFADVHVKHAAPLGQSSLVEAAREVAYRGRADGLIVSGAATGAATSLDDLETVRAAVPDRPLYVGSGATAEMASALLDAADGLIVGTAIKQNGVTTSPVDPSRAEAFVRVVKG
jgi:membrane complex biogenesis BtpA family protein